MATTSQETKKQNRPIFAECLAFQQAKFFAREKAGQTRLFVQA